MVDLSAGCSERRPRLENAATYVVFVMRTCSFSWNLGPRPMEGFRRGCRQPVDRLDRLCGRGPTKIKMHAFLRFLSNGSSIEEVNLVFASF